MDKGFEWIDKDISSERQKSGHIYYLTATPFPPNFRVDLMEDGQIANSENTGNSSFRELVDGGQDVALQMLEWGNYLLEHSIKECDKCRKEKFVNYLKDYDTEQEAFKGYDKLCSACRSAVYHDIFEKENEIRRKEDEAYKAELAKNPPHIVGGFKDENKALEYLKTIGNADVEEVEDGFVVAKGVLKANDGTFYPVLLHICVQDGGEFYGAEFLDDKEPRAIFQTFIGPYIGKKSEDIFPFKYKSIQKIDGDWHQNLWPDFS